MRILAAAGFLIALAAPAVALADAAADARKTKTFAACLDKAASTQAQLDCIAVELKLQDAALNRAYVQAARGLNARQKVTLQAAQRAWISFRDADCRSLEDQDWGSLSRVKASACMVDRTIERTIDLEAYPPN